MISPEIPGPPIVAAGFAGVTSIPLSLFAENDRCPSPIMSAILCFWHAARLQTSVQKAFRMQEQGEARLIDIRDVGELKQNGTVTG